MNRDNQNVIEEIHMEEHLGRHDILYRILMKLSVTKWKVLWTPLKIIQH